MNGTAATMARARCCASRPRRLPAFRAFRVCLIFHITEHQSFPHGDVYKQLLAFCFATRLRAARAHRAVDRAYTRRAAYARSITFYVFSIWRARQNAHVLSITWIGVVTCAPLALRGVAAARKTIRADAGGLAQLLYGSSRASQTSFSAPRTALRGRGGRKKK